jgi:23S rRNA A1618 N6-methylase RlmF
MQPIQTHSRILGLDVGTGASIIYPLLGCRLHDNWNFIATEVDLESVQIAQKNVNQNNLSKRIQIIPVSDSLSTPILQPICHETFSFTMCNPPFFELSKVLPLDTAAGQSATMSETMTLGGEVGFVNQMVKESIQWKNQCTWFTSMLGKKSSVKPVYETLKKNKDIKSIETTRLVQGRTSRWAIAWSFVAQSKNLVSSKKDTTSVVSKMFLIQGIQMTEAYKRISECINEMESVKVQYVKNKEGGVDKNGGPNSDGVVIDGDESDCILANEMSGAYQVKVLVVDNGNCQKNNKFLVKIVGSVEDYLRFERFVQKLKKDIMRTGRSWRRKLKRIKKMK